MATRRQERVSGRLIQELCDAVRELKDPRIGFVTFAEAQVAPDLRYAKIMVSVLGPEEDRIKTVEALEHSAGYLRKVIGRKLEMKYTPELHFVLDNSVKNSIEINRLIAEARAGDPNPEPEDMAEENDEPTSPEADEE